MEIRYIEWRDSLGGHGWEPLEEVRKYRPMLCKTAGFVAHEDDNCVTIVQSYDERTEGRPYGDNVISIPKFAIVKSKTVRK